MKNWDTEYREHIEKLERKITELEDDRKKDCIAFFYWWYNHIGGTNTEQGFDKWEREQALKK